MRTRPIPLRFSSLVFRLSVALIAASLPGCRNAPVSGRAQAIALPEQQEIQLGTDAWRKVLAEESITQNAHYAELVERVGQRIAAVANRPDYQWEFKVFAAEKANAFALPGGKVAIYEGILPVCENEAGLAVVMSHEISHVLARHGGERMTQQGIAQVGGGLLGKAIQRRSTTEQEKWMNAYGAASQYGVLLPYSRTHESEADSIGLTLMARAGYDPSEAPKFWQRFAEMSGPKPPEFLSTHPSDAHRASHLQDLLPQAMALYNAASDKQGTGIAIVPSNSTASSDRGIQLAGHEVPADDSTPAAALAPTTNHPSIGFDTVSVEQFLPSLDRLRRQEASPSEPADSFTAPSSNPTEAASEPAPFPGTKALPIGGDGWAPTSR